VIDILPTKNQWGSYFSTFFLFFVLSSTAWAKVRTDLTHIYLCNAYRI